VTKIVQKSV